jgi:hypothetical protein
MDAALVIKQEALREHSFTKNRQLLLERTELPRVHCKATLAQF